MNQVLSIEEMAAECREIRQEILRLSRQARTGHVGSSFSCVELLVSLYRRFLRGMGQVGAAERDRFILSKGHACVPYYACLMRQGMLPQAVYETYGEDGGVLGHHPPRLPEYGIDIGSGSLGHGLSIAGGLAFAAKSAKSQARSSVLLSDGELGEGSTWEAALFAAHHQLDNLLVVVDFNKMQALGNCAEVLGLEPLHEKFAAFGFGVRRIDGHSLQDIGSALRDFPFQVGRPSVIIADTVKGKGVSFMENSLLWHYRCPDGAEYDAAAKELADA